MKNQTPISLIIPAYRNAGLLKNCIESILENIDEIRQYDAHITVVNDSPEDAEVSEYLDSLPHKNISIINNKQNIGFVRSVNNALKSVHHRNGSVILINADTVTFPGTLKNLVSAAHSDPQIGFACPRSNNAALSTFPHFPHSQSGLSVSPKASFLSWECISGELPEITYTPTAVGFYLFISARVLYEFDALDEAYGLGYEEENDLIMRANKLGFLAILANKSFAYHYGSASFSLIVNDLSGKKAENLEIIKSKHPEFIPLVHAYENSEFFYAEKHLKNLIPSLDKRIRVIFDLTRLWSSFNGTSRLTKLILEHVCPALGDKFTFFALCSKDVFEFHSLNEINNLTLVSQLTDEYTIAINLGQPFDLNQINILEKLAPLNVYGMLDTIAYDCGYLRVENKFKLERYWNHIAATADGLLFISKFSHEEFLKRFTFSVENNLSRQDFSHLLPTKSDSYIPQTCAVKFGMENKHILVLGNHFKHKNALEAAKSISERFSSSLVICFGGTNKINGNLHIIKSGDLDQDAMFRIFSEASVVVLPSFYEGFGIGLIEALGFGKAIVARNIPVTKEILSSYKQYNGINLFDTNEEMLEMIQKSAGNLSNVIGGVSWNDWTASFSQFIENLSRKNGIYKTLVHRARGARALNEMHQLSQLIEDGSNVSTEPRPAEHRLSETPEISKNSSVNILSAFSQHDEDDFINAIYKIIMGRDVDIDGLLHYKKLLKKNNGDRVQIFRDLILSEEFRAMVPGFGKYRFIKKLF